MYHIYHTEAFVLGSLPKGEDSKILILYTRELGLVYAHAQGIRKLSSKLRFTLSDYSHVNVDLVRGKEVWRVTTATSISTFSLVIGNPETEKITDRIFKLIKRLVTGEEANEEIYNSLIRLFDLFSIPKNESKEYRLIELLTVSRILMALGYLSRNTLSDEGALSDIANQHRLIRDINQALSETHL